MGIIYKNNNCSNTCWKHRACQIGMIEIKIEVKRERVNIVSAYAPKVGCNLEEKENFWSECDDVM